MDIIISILILISLLTCIIKYPNIYRYYRGNGKLDIDNIEYDIKRLYRICIITNIALFILLLSTL